MGIVAIQRLRWGDGYIEPGEPVPEGEAGRDYAMLLRTGQAAEVAADLGGVPAETLRLAEADRDAAIASERAVEKLRLDDLARAEQLEAQVAALTAERDELAQLLEGATDSEPADPPAGEPDLPAGVTALGGGWFLLPNGEKVHGRVALDQALATE